MGLRFARLCMRLRSPRPYPPPRDLVVTSTDPVPTADPRTPTSAHPEPDPSGRGANGHGRRFWFGLALCLLPAATLAACGLAGDDGDSTATEGTAPPSELVDTAPGTVDGETTTATAVAGTTRATDDRATAPSDGPESATTGSTTTDAEPSPISFASDVEPIITRTCANCHTGTGPGTQHLRMDTAGIVAKASLGISFVVDTGFMPPWPASDESVAFEHDWSLGDEEVAMLQAWDDAGSPLDVPDDHRIVPEGGGTVRLDDPDVRVRSQGSYDGEVGQPDVYRCLVYDPGFDEDGFVTDMDFVPDQEQVVHHAVGFLLSGEDRDAVDALDGADGQGGWDCFGFSPGSSARLIYAWAPGQAATTYGETSGLEVEAGDFFVLQTHYHFEVEAPADRSRLDLGVVTGAAADGVDPVDVSVYLGPAEIPCSSAEVGPLCQRSAARDAAVAKYGSSGVLADGILAICGQRPEDYAGFTDGVASSTCDLPVLAPGEIISVFGHQHELGSSFRMTLDPDTPDETILLDIPVWDFDWQLNYEPVDSIVLDRGDTIRLDCTWDRALRDPELEPAYVLWADGTDDEMCFASIITRPT